MNDNAALDPSRWKLLWFKASGIHHICTAVKMPYGPSVFGYCEIENGCLSLPSAGMPDSYPTILDKLVVASVYEMRVKRLRMCRHCRPKKPPG
jgi:hypothetical protein